MNDLMKEFCIYVHFSIFKAVTSLVSVHHISTGKQTITNRERHFQVTEVLFDSGDLSVTMRNVSMTFRSRSILHDQDCSDILEIIFKQKYVEKINVY